MAKKDMQLNKEDAPQIEFSKEQIVKASMYTEIEKDILNALLENRYYTLEEVKKLLGDFNEREVK